MDFIDHRSTANFIFSLSATDEKLRIKSDGNVGIGVSNPSTKLEVDGVITTAGLTTSADINFGDNDKAVFGAGSDLQIYHDGFNSYIIDAGTGDLYFRSASNLYIGNATGTQSYITAADGGAVDLRYNGSAKLATTSTGIDVTGTVTADGLTSSGNLQIQKDTPAIELESSDGSSNSFKIIPSLSDSVHFGTFFKTNDVNVLKIANNGDISFYEDTGTTAKFFWDASAESLGIGTSSPSNTIHVEKSVSGDWLGRFRNTNTTNGYGLLVYAGDDSSVQSFKVANHAGSGDYFVVRGDGNVGIGTSSPSSSLTTEADSGVLVTDASGLRQIEIVPPQTSNSFVGEMGTRSSHPLVFNTVNTERMRIDSSGNVGVGTSSPSHKLSVSGSNSAARFSDDGTGFNLDIEHDTTNGITTLQQTNSGGDLRLQAGAASGLLMFDAGGTERMRLDASGQLLLGRSAVVTSGAEATRIQFYNINSTYDTASIRSLIGAGQVNRGELSFAVNNGAGQQERMRLDYSGNLLVGTTNLTHYATSTTSGHTLFANGVSTHSADGGTVGIFNRRTSDGSIVDFRKDGTSVGSIGSYLGAYAYIGSIGGTDTHIGFVNGSVRPATATGASLDATLDLGNSSGRFKDLHLSGTAYTNALGVGTTSPDVKVDIVDTAADVQLRVYKFDGTNNTRLSFTADDSGAKIHYRDATNGGALRFNNNAGEMARFDASGNLLVGTTSESTWESAAGFRARSSGSTTITRDGNPPLYVNRLNSDGTLLQFQKGTAVVGSIGTVDGFPYISSNSNVGLKFLSSRIRPVNSDGSDRDDAIDLGASSARFDDIYATNGTINTSDRNEKQDIAELSDAEQRVAVACKGLLRKFRWIDSVADKGDDARIHFGIIAQDLQDAFTAEGLDAGRYAMFTSTTWTDEETGEERTRMGVRYSELLAFIIAAI